MLAHLGSSDKLSEIIMAKIYTVIVRKDTVEGNQWNPMPCTRTITLVGKKRMCRSREEAEKQRQVYHNMSQDALRKKYGDGFYHGLEIVEYDIHEPGEARIKWEETDELYSMDLFMQLCRVFDKTGCKDFLVKGQQEHDGKPQGNERMMILSIGRTADNGYSGSLNDSMHFDWINKFRVHGWAMLMEEEVKEK